MKLFLLHVLMDYLKLWRTRQLLEEKKAQISEWDEKAKSDIEKEDVAWFKAAVVNTAFTPVAIHWSSEKGTMTDGWVGATMTLIGLIRFKTAWAAAA
jgi:hypothetical protein